MICIMQNLSDTHAKRSLHLSASLRVACFAIQFKSSLVLWRLFKETNTSQNELELKPVFFTFNVKAVCKVAVHIGGKGNMTE